MADPYSRISISDFRIKYLIHLRFQSVQRQYTRFVIFVFTYYGTVVILEKTWNRFEFYCHTNTRCRRMTIFYVLVRYVRRIFAGEISRAKRRVKLLIFQIVTPRMYIVVTSRTLWWYRKIIKNEVISLLIYFLFDWFFFCEYLQAWCALS